MGMSILEKGTIKRIRKVKELSGAGYNTYLITVESTIDLVLIQHYGGGYGLCVIDYTDGDGIGCFAFRSLDELMRMVYWDGKYYYFKIMSGRDVRVNREQFNKVIELLETGKVIDHAMDMTA